MYIMYLEFLTKLFTQVADLTNNQWFSISVNKCMTTVQNIKSRHYNYIIPHNFTSWSRLSSRENMMKQITKCASNTLDTARYKYKTAELHSYEPGVIKDSFVWTLLRWNADSRWFVIGLGKPSKADNCFRQALIFATDNNKSSKSNIAN